MGGREIEGMKGDRRFNTKNEYDSKC